MIRLWDVEGQSCIRVLNGHDNTVQQIAFAPNGTQLASAGSDSTVRVWDFGQGSIVHTFAGPEKFTAIAYSPTEEKLSVVGGMDVPAEEVKAAFEKQKQETEKSTDANQPTDKIKLNAYSATPEQVGVGTSNARRR